MDFFKGALHAAERAAEIAKAASQHGVVLAGGAAEQAAKKLGKLGLHEKIGAGTVKQAQYTPAQLEAVGITDDYIVRVSELHFSTFRDFPKDRLLEVPQASTSSEFTLNPWQLEHATLVCVVVREIHELRFMLCPRYMTDEHFWHTYFSLMKPHLPAEAFAWPADQAFNGGGSRGGGAGDGTSSPMASLFGDLKTQLQSFGAQVQERAAALGHSAAAASGAAAPRAETELGVTHANMQTGVREPVGGMPQDTLDSSPGGGRAPSSQGLELDPDLEAYLQVAVSEEGGEVGGEGATPEDTDFDDYLNELAAESGGGEEVRGAEQGAKPAAEEAAG